VRSASWLVLLVFGTAFVVAALVWVPRHPAPPSSHPLAASDVFTAAQVARAETFARWARVWSWGGLALSLVAYAWLGSSARLRRRLAGGGRWWVRALLAVLVVRGVVLAVELPWRLAGVQHARNAGLTDQAWGGVARDIAVGFAIDVVVTSVAVLGLLALIRRFPRRWPVPAGLGATALVLVGSFAYPLLVEPLFNHFTSLPEGPLRTEILTLADREGVPVDDVLVADASRRTTTLNAYVSGFGATRRVVLYDTLVDDLSDPEILSVVGHELGHARDDDVLIGTALGALGAGAAIGLLGLVLTWGGRRRAPQEVLRGDAGLVPCLLALTVWGSVLVLPLQNGISRQLETRADVSSLEATGDGTTFMTMQRRLAERSLADPTPPKWSAWWFGSHPGVLRRLEIARDVTGDPVPAPDAQERA